VVVAAAAVVAVTKAGELAVGRRTPTTITSEQSKGGHEAAFFVGLVWYPSVDL
jgi:hypothetical protein